MHSIKLKKVVQIDFISILTVYILVFTVVKNRNITYQETKTRMCTNCF